MLFAQLLGSLLGTMLDIVVIAPALLVGAISSSWRSLTISFAVALVTILAIKIPTIAAVAAELGHREPSYAATALRYSVAIIVWAGLVILLRRAFSGKWPISGD